MEIVNCNKCKIEMQRKSILDSKEEYVYKGNIHMWDEEITRYIYVCNNCKEEVIVINRGIGKIKKNNLKGL